jgi:hypothetical protein
LSLTYNAISPVGVVPEPPATTHWFKTKKKMYTDNNEQKVIRIEANAHLPRRLADIVCSYTLAKPMIIRYIVPPDMFVVLPFVVYSGYVYDCTIDWGDGEVSRVHGRDTTRRPTHVYTTPGRSVTIIIRGGGEGALSYQDDPSQCSYTISLFRVVHELLQPR